jgi:SAM-dependent methyltransferase
MPSTLLLRLLPQDRRSVLDIGARDGHFSQLLTEYFDEVTALDLEKPDFSLPRVTPVAGDATRLQFADNSFDCVFCAEVLEHIPDVAQACREIARVALHEVLVGVPYKQDTRLGRTTCQSCGCENPPWGHVNRFDEKRLIRLFAGLRLVSMSFVWSNREVTGRACLHVAFFKDLCRFCCTNHQRTIRTHQAACKLDTHGSPEGRERPL